MDTTKSQGESRRVELVLGSGNGAYVMTFQIFPAVGSMCPLSGDVFVLENSTGVVLPPRLF